MSIVLVDRNSQPRQVYSETLLIVLLTNPVQFHYILTMSHFYLINRILLTLVFLLLDNPASANGWTEIKELGKGQTVYWNAWGGGVEINQYIRWVGQEVNRKYDVELKHVKLSDTSEAVNRVLAEKIACRDQDGSVDLLIRQIKLSIMI